MSKPIVISVPCGSNSVSAGKWLKKDGAGAYSELAAASGGLGVALTNKNINNVVGCVKLGLMKLPAVNAAYNHGDKLELDSSGQKLTAFSAGEIVAMAAETKTIAVSGDPLEVLVWIL